MLLQASVNQNKHIWQLHYIAVMAYIQYLLVPNIHLSMVLLTSVLFENKLPVSRGQLQEELQVDLCH